MKKKNLLCLCIMGALFLILPFTVQAKEAVTIYFFKGETCSYCHAALDFFDTLKEDKEYKDKFEIIEYEVWNNDDNADLMNAIAKKRGDTLKGVPYFIIGDKMWNGFDTSYRTAIKEQILKIYNDENYVDELSTYVSDYASNPDKKEDTTLLTIAIVVGIVVIAGIALYFARSNSDDEDEIENEKVEKKKEVEKEEKLEEKKTEQKKETTSKSNSTAKKVNNTKKTTTKKKPTSNNSKKKNTSNNGTRKSK